MMHVWEFDESLDTPKSYKGFSSYRDLGVNRSLPTAYALYQGRSEGVKRAAGYFERWCRDGDWQARAAAFDLHRENLEREIKSENDKSAYLDSLAEFRDSQLRLGKAAVLASIESNRKIVRFLQNFGEIGSLDDALLFARMIKLLEGGSDLWARGLCVDQILENFKSDG